ncbi:hypothetical protein FRC12_000350 [Ceratobasidium sp. 428]|nr:hypothetical protein FRC12_000350 [Ceratobasidium sp. 428]
MRLLNDAQPSNTLVHHLPFEYTSRLTLLRELLVHLPVSIPLSEGTYYPFQNFQIDERWVENTGSPQGAVNHALEVAFGSRAERIQSGGLPVAFEHRGVDLECVVDVLTKYLTGDSGLDALLLKWLDDLIASAKPLVHTAVDIPVNYDPEKLTNVPSKRSDTGRGRKSSALLDKLTIYCRDEKGKLHARCAGPGCTVNWTAPCQSRSVLPHARACQFLTENLREEAQLGLHALAPSAQLEKLETIMDNELGAGAGSGDVTSTLEAHVTERRKLVGEDLLIRCICCNFLAPTIIDSPSFRDYVAHLDPKTKLANSSTYVKLINAEAEAALDASVQELAQQTNLTISFDGATIRGSQSIYTVHVTSPETRQAHLIEANEASGEAHTATHIKSMLLKVFELIPATHFSGISSDNTGNTRLARELLAQDHPHIIILPDPCHHMHNCAKEICILDYFKETVHRVRIIIRFFSKSTFATFRLTVLRILKGIPCGLVQIGNTRFLIIYYAIHALLPCLQPITELIYSNVLKIGKTHRLAWMTDLSTFRQFENKLHQLHALLQPFARAVICLESSAFTPGDVYYLWIAAQATLHNLFPNPHHLDGRVLPVELIQSVRGIVNGRYSEALEGPDRQCYSSAFYLDPRYIGSEIFKQHHVNPLSTTITLNRHSFQPDAAPGNLINPAIYDDDLRRSHPAYVRAGQYLIPLLRDEVNSGRTAYILAQSQYRTWEDMVEDLRI